VPKAHSTTTGARNPHTSLPDGATSGPYCGSLLWLDTCNVFAVNTLILLSRRFRADFVLLFASATLGAWVAACGTSTGVGGTITDAGLQAEGNSDAGALPTDAGGVACGLAYGAFNSSAKINAQSTYAWTCTETTRKVTGNGIPDHAVTTGTFATPVGVQNLSISFPLKPADSGKVTLRPRQATGYALNSVKFDPETAGTCMSSATSTMNGGGCVMVMGRDPWLIEAMGGAFRFGTDESNAHTQPNGQYHYHGMPEAMLADKGKVMALVGFAVDGFPVYARYGYGTANDASSELKVLTTSWQLKASPDAGRPDVSIFPLGTFTNDFEYVAGSGDLDECNGRVGITPEFPQGTYHYYITETFPFIQRCVKGTPL
jgi:hypothetical protein